MLCCAPEALGLTHADHYYYLKQSGCVDDKTINDTHTFQEVMVRTHTHAHTQTHSPSTKSWRVRQGRERERDRRWKRERDRKERTRDSEERRDSNISKGRGTDLA